MILLTVKNSARAARVVQISPYCRHRHKAGARNPDIESGTHTRSHVDLRTI